MLQRQKWRRRSCTASSGARAEKQNKKQAVPDPFGHCLLLWKMNFGKLPAADRCQDTDQYDKQHGDEGAKKGKGREASDQIIEADSTIRRNILGGTSEPSPSDSTQSMFIRRNTKLSLSDDIRRKYYQKNHPKEQRGNA